MTHDVFICHSSKDRAVANAICSHLEQDHIRCWIAPRDVLAGSDYAVSIVEAIAGSKLAVLVFSDHSNHSAHVHREIERCVSHGIPILPFRLEEVVPSPSLEYFISNAHWLDAVTPPLEQHLHHLVGTVRLLLERDASTTHGPARAPLPPPAMSPVVRPPPPTLPAPPSAPPPGAFVPTVAAVPARRRTGLWVTLGAAAATVAVLLAMVLVRGGGEDSSSSPTQAPVDTEDVAPSTNPDTKPDTTTTTAPTPTTPVDGSGVLRGPVDVLDSFAFTQHMTFEFEGMLMVVGGSGVYLAPGDQQCTMTFEMQGATFTNTAVIVGDRAWFDDGTGSGLQETTPDDWNVTSMLAGCPTSHEMWGEEFGAPPPGGTDVTVEGLALISYDVTAMAGLWGPTFGLPAELTVDQMVIRVSQDRTWVAGMDADMHGSAEVFREAMGIPPEGVTGDCRLTLTLDVQRPNDPTLTITVPG